MLGEHEVRDQKARQHEEDLHADMRIEQTRRAAALPRAALDQAGMREHDQPNRDGAQAVEAQDAGADTGRGGASGRGQRGCGCAAMDTTSHTQTTGALAMAAVIDTEYPTAQLHQAATPYQAKPSTKSTMPATCGWPAACAMRASTCTVEPQDGASGALR